MFNLNGFNVPKYSVHRNTSNDIRWYRDEEGYSYSLLKTVPNFIETKKNYEQDKWSPAMGFGDLVDRMLLLEDWDHTVRVVDGPTVDMAMVRQLRKLKDSNGEITPELFAEFYRSVTGKFNSYKDKTLYEKYYVDKYQEYVDKLDRDDIIFVSREDMRRAAKSIRNIINNPVVKDFFLDKDIFTQVPYILEGQLPNKSDIRLKGLLDIVAINNTDVILADLKVSTDPFRSMYRQKWVLQGAFYTFLWVNSMLLDDSLSNPYTVINSLKAFIWIIHNPDINNTYVFKVDIPNPEVFIIDRFEEFQGSGIASENPLYQYILGDESSNVMSIYERIEILDKYVKDGFVTDPKSLEPIDIAPIPPYNLGI